MAIETLSEHACFGGVQGYYRHASDATRGAMKFSVFRPPQARGGAVPVLFCLAGLTCNEETFAIKAGAQRVAADLGLMLVAPDTSPRDTGMDGATGDWEFGEGAGFYLDATQAPWSQRFRMRSYVAEELPQVVADAFAADVDRAGIVGHSMGGHGALTLALTSPERFRSVSAFAPIVAPTQVPWGHKAFSRYLGEDRNGWETYDACALLRAGKRFASEPLVDQGLADTFLASQLQPERLEAACAAAGQPLTLRRHAGYDHGYFFIASFVEAHLRHHARILLGPQRA
ncbi:S-formylglutathione hydrolase [Chiayiivirga flava]|uniref:S-formylglutathione hydrolase n=2 Tax=Chiayiivirga flava TaxID=659595 RepID=A0A7W8D288_9GAMM|nr:S-formylglutathione hydrolase [Chiayiivirga flava]